MYWFETNPDRVKDHKQFLLSAVKQYISTSPGEAGDEIGRYLSKIQNKKTLNQFLTVIEELCSDPSIESWIQRELRQALDEDFKRTLDSVFDAYTLEDQVRIVKEFSSAIKEPHKNKKEIRIKLLPKESLL
ncbi:hypothetical protein L0222_26155 [bacterium]|nr:hypothetical protein [bacterium]